MIDVNGDRRVTPFDALQVLNHVNQAAALAGTGLPPEGEFDDRDSSNESPELYDAAVDAFLAGSKTTKAASFDSHNSVEIQSPDSHSDLQEQDAKSKDDYENAVDLVLGECSKPSRISKQQHRFEMRAKPAGRRWLMVLVREIWLPGRMSADAAARNR